MVVRPRLPGGILAGAQEDNQGQKRPKEGQKRSKTGLPNSGQNRRGKEIRQDLSEDSQMRCKILRQFGIMWLAPFCHLNPGRFRNFSGL